MDLKATATITYEIPLSLGQRSPEPGEYIRTVSRRDGSTGTVYLIYKVREVRPRKPCPNRKYKLVVQRGYTVADITGGSWVFHWHSRRARGRI